MILNKEKDWSLLIDRIVKSSSFGKSAIYENLLRFLAKCTTSDEVPKEATISTHLFGEDKSYQDSSQVRVYVYHLRKKLDQYFKNEGASEEYILSIPKGGYAVTLSKRNEQNKYFFRWSQRQWLFASIIVLLLASLVFNIFLISRDTNTGGSEGVSKDELWSDFFSNGKSTLLLLGDLFVFSETDSVTGQVRNIRIPDINSRSQFLDYTDSLHSSSLIREELTYTYLIKSSATGVESLTRIFDRKNNFHTRVISRMDTKDLHDHNILFVGMQKTAGILNNYFERSDYFLVNDGVSGYGVRIDGALETYAPFGNPDETHTDYGFVAKYPGPNNNVIFMFAGIWDTATSESLTLFTDPLRIREVKSYMMENLGEIPAYFEMLIEVSGVDRLGFDTKIIHAKKIN